MMCWCHSIIHLKKGGAKSVTMKAYGGVDDPLFEFQTDIPEVAFSIRLPIDKT